MSRLIYVRHGQASFGKADYDQLSDQGYQQSRILGDHFVDTEVEFSHIYYGPLKRHRQTLEMVQEAYRDAGKSLPEAIMMPELDEHRGPDILKASMIQIRALDEQIREWDEQREADKSLFFKNGLQIFDRAMMLWATGQIAHLQPVKYLDWKAFRGQVSSGYDQVVKRHKEDKSATIGLFTSGGTISAMMGHLLGMASEQDVISLNAIVQNTSITEVLFAKYRRPALHRFNDVSHLPSHMLTYV